MHGRGTTVDPVERPRAPIGPPAEPEPAAALPPPEPLQPAAQQPKAKALSTYPRTPENWSSHLDLQQGRLTQKEAEERGFCIACHTPNKSHRGHIHAGNCIMFPGSSRAAAAVHERIAMQARDQQEQLPPTPAQGSPLSLGHKARATTTPSSYASIEDAGAAEAVEQTAIVQVMTEASSASAAGPTDDLSKDRG